MSPADLKKETWKPKTSLRWYDNPRGEKTNIKIE